MGFFGFNFIENFFFISLGITFSLIILLVYHFKQRITSMERKGDTMYELITNVVKELQFMKNLNAYYESLFRQPALTENEISSKASANTTLNAGPAVTGTESTPKTPPSTHLSYDVRANSRIVVSDDDSSVSSEESDSVDSSMNYSTIDVDVHSCDNSDSDSDSEDDDDTSFADAIPVYTAEDVELKEVTDIVDSVNEFAPVKPVQVPLEIPVEINELMGMIQNALVSGISPPEPQKFAPYYEIESPESTHYKPVVIETDGEVDAQIIDVLAIEENTLERTIEEEYAKIESVHDTMDAVELDGNVEGEIPKNQEEEQAPDTQVTSSTANNGEQPSVPLPEPTDKKQTREVYRKMNITQLRGIAVAAGITTDTTKMKKNELIQLLENLEE
jgi:hypothetical protein